MDSNARVRLQTFALLASVFLTGTAMLIVEILAIRILSPYYGNTIYTTSSVIGVILAALSLGYYLGGKLADKYPSYHVFYGIIFISALAILLQQGLQTAILPVSSVLFSLSLGPFICSLCLFFLPAFFLGTLSPVAVALHMASSQKIGSAAGAVFFWSTCGSIFGTVMSGFFLIPFFGINAIIITTGLVLGTWAFICFAKQQPHNSRIIIAMIIILVALACFLYVHPKTHEAGLVYEHDGIYERIRIQDGLYNGRPARFLFQDRSYSAAMYKDSDELVYDYTKYYSLYKLINLAATRALVIGGGGYSIPKALLHDSPNMRVDVAEIEPLIYENAKTYFNLPQTDRLQNYTQDGRQLLARTKTNYDIIVGDAYYSLFSVPIQLTTREFFTLAKSRLSENGVFIGNFAGYVNQEDRSLIASEIKTFRGVFSNSYFFAVQSADSQKTQNIIFLGINGSKNPDLGSLSAHLIDINKAINPKAQVLTDNFAPIEYLAAKMIPKWR